MLSLNFRGRSATKPASFDCIPSSTSAKDSEARTPEDSLACEDVLDKLALMIHLLLDL